MLIVLIILGAILAGALFSGFEFVLLGGFLGFLLGLLYKLSDQVKQLNQQVSLLQQRSDHSQKQKVWLAPNNPVKDKSELELLAERAEKKSSDPIYNTNQNSEVKPEVIKSSQDELPPLKSPIIHSHSNIQQTDHNKTNDDLNKERTIRGSLKPKEPDLLNKLISIVIGYFTQGNVVVRVGVVVLFFGVSFLLKYAAENSKVPIELRLIGVIIGAIALLVFGWKLKDKKQGYGLILQGAAVGILYLSLFSAFRLYSLVPAELAFPLLIIFCGLAMTLAVLQDSRALAVLSAAGGFLAPVLISTGSGNHVVLFSYFTVLNLAIFGVAWFKAWRLLNLIGFVFTFVIGAAWGVTKYQAADFTSTEPFLILFYALYTAIALLYADKYKAEIKGYVDSSLIFGLPFIAFSLQVAMVESYDYGLAWSAFALGAFYLTAAYLIIKSKNANLLVIGEAFVALGIIFTTLVVPFALDSEWTAATWAIEGAGLIWLGLRQSRWFAKYFGCLIQIAGGLIFINELDFYIYQAISLDAQLLGIVFVSAAAIFSSYQIWLRKKELKQFEATSRFFFLAWGLIWWYLGGFFEISQFTFNSATHHYLILFVSLSALLWHGLEIKLKWLGLVNLVWLTLPLLLVLAIAYLDIHQHLFSGFGAVFWALAIGVFYGILYNQDKLSLIHHNPTRYAVEQIHLICFLLLFTLSFFELNWLLNLYQINQTSWAVALTGTVGCGWLFLIIKLNKWPVTLYEKTYGVNGLFVVMLMLVFWSATQNIPHDGNAFPLSYIPLLNPLDIVQALVFFGMYHAIDYQQKMKINYSDELIKRITIGFVFIWLNIILLRSIHAWTEIEYNPNGLFQSSLVQTSLSIFWTTLGLIGSVYATKSASRKLWFSAASLIGLVVFKLFVIDLDNSSSIERIVSFVVVGLLLLIVGYFSPLPPKLAESISEENDNQSNNANGEKI